jgi:hypothetical protein
MQDIRAKLQATVSYPVVVAFSDPYYRLLVGQFATRAEAEEAQYEVRGKGYPDAFIVKGVVGAGD